MGFRFYLPLLLGLLGFAAAPASSATCPPKLNPKGDFVGNFNNACYALTLETGGGTLQAGDPNATYDQVFYTVTPGYELVLIGNYPNARFMSVTAYDSHLATTATVNDDAILPLNSSMHNPYLVGGTYAPSQEYGVTISFGGTLTSTPTAGCSATDSTIDQNILNASQIHQGLSWNGSPYVPLGFPVHVAGANTAGAVMVRKYLDIAGTPPEVVIVRNLATGCGLLVSQAKQMNIISVTQTLSSSWLNQAQISGHRTFSDGSATTTALHPNLCFPPDPTNALQWYRTPDYQPEADSASADIFTTITSAQVQSLITAQQFVQIQFPFPSVPDIPCTAGSSCSLTGAENLRYLSLALQGPSGGSSRLTLAAIADTNFVKDPNGNVTLVIGLGATPPPTLTAANGYTYLDLTGNPNLSMLERFYIRNILPNPLFLCADGNVPFYSMEYNPEGGYMGPNVPTMSFVTAAQIPSVPPVPPARPNSCGLIPPAPTACTTN